VISNSRRFKIGFIILRYEIRIEGSSVLYGTLQSISDEEKVETELDISRYGTRIEGSKVLCGTLQDSFYLTISENMSSRV